MIDPISPRAFEESEGARLVQAISELTGIEEHRPDVDLRPAA